MHPLLLPSLILLLPPVLALPKILIFSRTLGFRHDSIPTALSQLNAYAARSNLSFEHTEDPTHFTSGGLSVYDAVMFLMSTDSTDEPIEEVLDSEQKSAFLEYLALGGNYVGIHAASQSLTLTPWFGNETGAVYDHRSELQNGTIIVLDASNPSTASMPTEWNYEEEWYSFKSDPRKLGATVLITVNESTYTDTQPKKSNEGTPHPIAWVQEHGSGAFAASPAPSSSNVGRSFYTSLGHLNSTWMTEWYMSHVLGGIAWVLEGNTTRAFDSAGSVGNPSNSSASGGTTTMMTTGTGTSGGSTSTASMSPSSSPTSGAASRRYARVWDF